MWLTQKRISRWNTTKVKQLAVVKRVLKLLIRRGYLVEDQGQTYLEGESEEGALATLKGAATSYRIGLGPRRGQKVYPNVA